MLCIAMSTNVRMYIHVVDFVFIYGVLKSTLIDRITGIPMHILGVRMCSEPHTKSASLTWPAQLCTCMSINDILDCDEHVRTYVHTS